MNRIKELEERTEVYCLKTELYRQMKARKGNIAVFKGSMTPDILLIGEAPGKEEDKRGIPFIGKSGEILDEWIKLSNKKDIAITNCVPIMPTNGEAIRKPTKEEIEYFRVLLYRNIYEIKPKKVIILGRSANEAIFPEKKLKQGQWYLDEKTGLFYGFIYHPSFFLRKGQTGEKEFLHLMRFEPK